MWKVDHEDSSSDNYPLEEFPSDSRKKNSAQLDEHWRTSVKKRDPVDVIKNFKIFISVAIEALKRREWIVQAATASEISGKNSFPLDPFWTFKPTFMAVVKLYGSQ